jgi:hypothetical protein
MIILKKDDIPELRIDNKFGYVVGDQIHTIRLYDYIITDIEGENVTLKKVINND